MARTVEVTELALRDGHQSLLATRMATEDLAPACAESTRPATGASSAAVFGPGTVIGDAAVMLVRALAERLGLDLEEPPSALPPRNVSVGTYVS
jgi:pyruvate carboxylase